MKGPWDKYFTNANIFGADIHDIEIFSDKFTSFVSRMWLDHCDETNDMLSVTEDYPTYLINNFKYLVRRFNTENGNEEWNVK